MKEQENVQRTLGFAELALKHLRQHKLPATPSYFAFWYAYATGLNGSLNCAVDATMATRGRLTPDEIQRLRHTYLSQAPTDRIDEIGGEIVSDITDISTVIAQILAETAEYGARLAEIMESVDQRSHGTAEALEFLAEASRRIEEGRRSLEERLQEARSGFDTLRSSLETVRVGQQNDPLTTLATRKHFDTAIERAINEAVAEGTSLALILTDIDHFKSFNDRYGHQTGDQVLRLVAQSAKQNIRGQDIACRYGGEEFAIILPSTTEEQAALVGEHIRQAVMSRELVKRSTGETIGHLTVSAGIAALRPGDTPQSLIERADSCLYAAKRAGRNLVISESRLGDSDRDVA